MSKVTYAALHFPIFVPQVGQFGPTLTTTGSGAAKGIKMTLEGNFVTLEVQDKNGKPNEILVPLTSFTHMVVAK